MTIYASVWVMQPFSERGQFMLGPGIGSRIPEDGVEQAGRIVERGIPLGMGEEELEQPPQILVSGKRKWPVIDPAHGGIPVGIRDVESECSVAIPQQIVQSSAGE